MNITSQSESGLVHLAEMALRQARVVRDAEHALELMKQELREISTQVGTYPIRVGIPGVGVITVHAPECSDSKSRISFTF